MKVYVLTISTNYYSESVEGVFARLNDAVAYVEGLGFKECIHFDDYYNFELAIPSMREGEDKHVALDAFIRGFEVVEQ